MFSRFLVTAQQTNQDWEANNLRYIYYFLVSRAAECFDFVTTFLCPRAGINQQLLLQGYDLTRPYVLPEGISNLNEIMEAHLRKLHHFIRARNNLIQLLPERLTQLKILLKRHINARKTLFKIEER